MTNEPMLTDNGYQQLMKHACRLAQDGHGELAQHLRDAIDLRARIDAAPAVPQQAEPVGYFVNDESDDQWHQVDYEQRNGADTYPLYLHPPAAEVQRLRDALTALLDHYVSLVASGDAGKWDAEQEPQVIAARRALGGE